MPGQLSNISPIHRPSNHKRASLVLRLNFKIRRNNIYLDNRLIADRRKFKRGSLSETMRNVNHFLTLTGISPKTLGLKIFGDAEKISFIEYSIRELIVNAVDSCRENGNVILTIGKQNDQIEILCKDNGTGIRNPQHIFNFQYSDKSTANQSNGWITGGGGAALYFIQRTLDAIKGKIEIVETSNRGTTIRIILPNKFSKLRCIPRMLIANLRIFGNQFGAVHRYR
jgi:signal transduction histidine kinase